jgi:diaminopimelate epimerase
MAKILSINFQKFHGLGNDFIVTRGRGLPRALAPLARAIAERHTGVGADGFLVVVPPANRKHDARVRFFNADGSEPEMSGNGIRCVGAFLLAEGRRQRELALETAAGLKILRLVKSQPGRWVFRVSMGAPILEAGRIPFEAGGAPWPIVNYPLQTAHGEVRVTVSSMGNPHCSIFVESFESLAWPTIGNELELDEHFPNRTNVEFVKVLSRRRIEVRFFERGVGKTQSSGTGACGAVVASILNGFTDRRVTVSTLAGKLEVEWPENGQVALTGPVERIAHGVYDYRQ